MRFTPCFLYAFTFALVLNACEAAPAKANVAVGLSTLKIALGAAGRDVRQATLESQCDDGRQDRAEVVLDASSPVISADFVACGPAQLVLSAKSASVSDPVTTLYGEARVNLEGGKQTSVDLIAYLSGELKLTSSAASNSVCNLRIFRRNGQLDRVERKTRLDSGATNTFVLPGGDYEVQCLPTPSRLVTVVVGERRELTLVATASVSPSPSPSPSPSASPSPTISPSLSPSPSPSPPSFLSDDLQAKTLPNASSLTVTVRFSQPVNAGATGAFVIAGVPTGASIVSMAASADRTTWTVTLGNLVGRGEYDLLYTTTIVNDAGLGLAGSVLHHFSVPPLALYVRTAALGGSDTNPGTQAAPFATPNYAVSKALGPADIFVAQGDYTEAGSLALSLSGVRLLGGWATDFSKRIGWSHLTTTGAIDAVLNCNAGVDRSTWVDHFWLDQRGTYGTVVNLNAGDVTLSNDLITQNGVTGLNFSIGVAAFGGAPLLFNNFIFGGQAVAGSGGSHGIFVQGGAPVIVNNSIDAGLGPTYVEGIRVYTAVARPLITNNLVFTSLTDLTTLPLSAGIFLENADATPASLQNNFFAPVFRPGNIGVAFRLPSFAGQPLGAGDFGLDGRLPAGGPTIRAAANQLLPAGVPVFVSANPTALPSANNYVLSTPVQAGIAGKGKAQGSADCGGKETPTGCSVPALDINDVLRATPPSVGASEL